MTDAVHRKGCDSGASLSYNPKKANALFEMAEWWPLPDPHRSAPENAINYLISNAYEVEEQNSAGLTPLVHAATTYKPQVIRCLNTFIRKGADVHAVDLEGRNALHCALAVPHIFDAWNPLRLVSFADHKVLNHYYVPAYVYHTQSTAYAEDYEEDRTYQKAAEPEERELAQHGPFSELEAEPNWDFVRPGCKCGFKVGSAATESLIVKDPPTRNDGVLDDLMYGFVRCEAFGGVEHIIRHPIQVLKVRLRFKLLTLLNANCDPNVVDKAGLSPGDYAGRDGLWPEFKWALDKAGYVRLAGDFHWVRDSAFN